MRMDRYDENKDVKQDKHESQAETERRLQKQKKRKRIRIILIVILVLVIALAAGGAYMYKSALDSLSVTFTDEKPEIEFGTEVDSMNFVSDSVGTVTPARQKLDTNEIGPQELSYTASKELFAGLMTAEKEFTFKYTVVDTQAPVVLWNGSGSTIQTGSDFDLNTYFGYGDNADPTPEIEVKGKVKTGTAGTYTIQITLTDDSGNETKDELTISVADSISSESSEQELTSFEDFAKTYEGDGNSFGIDVSTWQDDIDFEKVKKAGCEFVIIRIGYSSDGEVTMDSKFQQNYKNARAAGLKVGVYLYSYDNTEDEVRNSADWIVDQLAGDELDLPIAFDWENFGEFQNYEMSFVDLNSYYDAFADELAQNGYDTMLYGSKNFLEKVWTNTSTRTVWLAHYTDKTDYSSPYKIWQASQSGTIDGIDGAVDLNIMYN